MNPVPAAAAFPLVGAPEEATRRKALRLWQRAAGAFAAWAFDLAAALREEATAGLLLVLVDRPAVEALRAAPALARRGVAPVPVMRRWPAAEALLSAAPLLAALPALAPLLRRPARPVAAALLLESERLMHLAEPDAASPASPLRSRFDNRYTLDAIDLPGAAWLHAVGVVRVLAAVPAAAPQPAPDVADYFAALTRAGFPVGLLPLDTLPAPEY
ncbi:MAG: hypothetical protein NTZ05_11930 [Chloroflexi bacterium]|nr:hypothetical protein [Chloroflexota bacterium]